MVRWAFDLLGIEATKDKKQIKKAYASKVRLCHPEDEPVEWERLHEAYQTALEYAQSPEEIRKESEDVSPQEIRISPDLAYGEMFQEAQQQWLKERSLEEQKLLQDAARSKKSEKKKKLIFIPAVLLAGLILIGMVGLQKEHAAEDGVTEIAAKYLNEKYGGSSYSTENLETEKEDIIGDFIGRMDSYAIRSRETGIVIAYAMRGEHDKEGEYAFFDNIQETEIRKGFEEMVNTAAGHEEGRLFWDSSTTDTVYGGIEDGFFHTKYEGDFLNFIVHEAARRADTPTGDPEVLASDYRSMNGICDYYLPDPAVKTIDERLCMSDPEKDTTLLEALDACAEDCQVQLRCSVLPETLFQKRIARAEENGYNVFVLNDIQETFGMQPAMSFLMLTGWYVSLPPDDGKRLGISNGMYMQPVLAMGEGIYGTESSIKGQAFSGDPEWVTGSIVKTENPEISEITEEESQRAVSFRLADGCVLKNNFALAIKKDQYGIADTGYRVIVTKQTKAELDVAGQHLEAPAGTPYEKYVCNYQDAGAILRQSDVMDGEGYLFIEYQAAENAETADIITVINP